MEKSMKKAKKSEKKRKKAKKSEKKRKKKRQQKKGSRRAHLNEDGGRQRQLPANGPGQYPRARTCRHCRALSLGWWSAMADPCWAEGAGLMLGGWGWERH
jgi:hypothetical protein